MLGAAALLLAAASAPARDLPTRSHSSAVDSAKEEMRAGRFWHAARILRAAGLPSGDRENTLLLASADAGWHNWPGVLAELEGKGWLGDVGGGEGWLLVGRAQEEAARWSDAAVSYRSYLARLPSGDARAAPVLARLARAVAHGGRPDEVLAAVDEIPAGAAVVRSWIALELAIGAADAGDTTTVVALLARIGDDGASDAGWNLLPRTRLAAGDSAGAEQGYRAVAATTTGSRQAEAMVAAGVLTLARQDSAAAAKLFTAALDDAPRSAAARAAAGLVAIGGTTLELTVRLASILDRAGDGAPALKAYDRAARLAARGEGTFPGSARLARARLMATVRSRQDEAIDEFRAIRAETKDERIGARNLETWADVRRRQGRTGDVNTLRKWLLAEYPASPEAAEVRWDRATTSQTSGDVAGALAEFATLAAKAPTLGRAGEARMRTGQIHLGRGETKEAARVFEAYLKEFPSGRRWDEASYWAARIHLQLGDSAVARELVARIRKNEPVSYYAVMGARLLGEPYDVDVPAGEAPASFDWLDDGLARLDLLAQAGLDQGVDAEEKRLEERADGTPAAQLRLAEELNDRGRTLEGINIGWTLRGEGQPWDRRLLRVVYPFPYRELVVREAAEWGVDPILLAALIRQESAFKADVRSGAGAVGLMQVMPPTGRALARTYGPEDFHEKNLTTPEVNLHLGAAFFVDMNRRYGGDLPIVLSAYNAGPTRATRWRRYPEASDPDRFVERIPFEETRGYVKNIRRNVGVYQALYGLE